MSGDRRLDTAEELAASFDILADAEDLAGTKPRIAAREAYVAMFRAAQARIAAQDIVVPSTHKGVSLTIASLYRGDSFAAQSELSRAERWKQAGDYGRGALPNVDEAEDAVAAARHFCARMQADIIALGVADGDAIADVDFNAIKARAKQAPD